MRISDWSSDVCSSDLGGELAVPYRPDHQEDDDEAERRDRRGEQQVVPEVEAAVLADQDVLRVADQGRRRADVGGAGVRSEEHTSELQSLMRSSYAVFCLTNRMSASQTTRRQNVETQARER